MPQRPYTAVGTLRDQLIYPLTSDQEVEPLTHGGMVELLKNVEVFLSFIDSLDNIVFTTRLRDLSVTIFLVDILLSLFLG